MSTIQIITIAPLSLFVIYLLIHLGRGRLPTRFSLNVTLSLLLLVYFLAAAATGIFWVAAQELPIFDWHYLSGYVLLALGVTHVILNWKPVAIWLRRRSPAALKDREGKRFSDLVKGAAITLVLAGAGIVLFLAGVQFSSETVVIMKDNESTAARTPEDGEATADTGIPPLRVEHEGESMSVAEFYHRGCSYPARAKLSGVTWKSKPPVYKEYPDLPAIPLPDVKPDGGGSVLAAAEAWRSWGPRLAVSTMTLEDLSLLLYHGQGINKILKLPGRSFDLRCAPSAGALYPVNVYVAVNRVEGLTPGLYHFHVKRFELLRMKEGPCFDALEAACERPRAFQPAAATVILTATFGRTGFKYKDRCYRYVNMDTGHAAANLALVAASKGLAAPLLTRFDDGKLDALLGIDGREEASLLVIPLGTPLEASASVEAPPPEPVFVRDEAFGAAGEREDFLSLIHGATRIKRGPAWSLPRPAAAPFRDDFPSPSRAAGINGTEAEEDGTGEKGIPTAGAGEADSGAEPSKEILRDDEVHALPEPAEGDPLWPAIRRRRSVRKYTDAPMTQAELTALCATAAGTGAWKEPFHRDTPPIRLYVAVRHVEGIAPGIYGYDRGARRLVLRKMGDLSGEIRGACLNQEFCGTADAVFFKTARWEDLLDRHGDRGYRYACLRSGVVGNHLYLAATALNLGVCGVGAFLDGDAAAVIGTNPAIEPVLYITAVGK